MDSSESKHSNSSHARILIRDLLQEYRDCLLSSRSNNAQSLESGYLRSSRNFLVIDVEKLRHRVFGLAAEDSKPVHCHTVFFRSGGITDLDVLLFPRQIN